MGAEVVQNMGVYPVKEKKEEFRGGTISLFDAHVCQKGENARTIRPKGRATGSHIHVDNDLDKV